MNRETDMTHPTDIIERLRTGTLTRGCAAAHEAAELIDRYRKATGGLDPALAARYLQWAQEFQYFHPGLTFTRDEIAALRAATFEETE